MKQLSSAQVRQMYAVKLAQRLGDNQKYLEFTASRDTGYGIETMLVEVRRNKQYVGVVYYSIRNKNSRKVGGCICSIYNY